MTGSARLALGAVLSVSLALPGSALGANIAVDTTTDAIGANGSCSLREAITAADFNSMGPGGDCDPGTAGPDAILLGANTYELDEANVSPGGENSNVTGDLDITTQITIDGAGIDQTTIDANSIDRVLQVFNSATDVEFRDLTITGGAAPDGGVGTFGGNTGPGVTSLGGVGGGGEEGGGIFNGGDLALTSVEVSNNVAGSGGAGGNAGTAGDGAPGGAGGASIGGQGGSGGGGGGVSQAAGAELHVTDSVFENNIAGNGGNGGIGSTAGAGGAAPSGTFGGASVGGQGGFAGDGGAIFSAGGVVDLTRVTMTGNEGGDSGAGGIGGAGGTGGTGTAGVGGSGGASSGGSSVFGGFGGAIGQQGTTLTITDSRLAGNKAGRGGDGGPAGAGGGGGTGSGSGAGGPAGGGDGGPGGGNVAIDSFTGAVTLIRTTVSGNSSGAAGDGGDGGPTGTGSPGSNGGNGGTGGSTAGISQNNGGLNLTNSTVSGNTAGAGGDGGAGGSGPTSAGGSGADGGGVVGVAAAAGVSGTLLHVTIAGNLAGAGGAGGAAGSGTTSTPGDAGSAGTVGGFFSNGTLTLRNSIIASNTATQCSGAGFTDGGSNLSFPTDISCPATLHADPLLDPLASNGGDTQTMALGVGSPAIDAVSANCQPTDQREIARPRGPACDIGAFESAAPLVTTGAFSAVTGTSAGVAGTVNPNTRATTYRFAFGTSLAYGSLTPPVAAGAGAAAVAASAGLTGLVPGALYHYRVTATNADGTTVGADKTFTTAAAPKTTTPSGTTPSEFAGVSILTKAARADRKGRVSVKLRCPAAAVVRCKGKLSLTAKVKVKRKVKKAKTKTIKLGSARFDIAAGKTKTVRIKLSRSKRRLLATSKRVKGALSAAATDTRGGKAKTTKGKLGVKAPKRRKRP